MASDFGKGNFGDSARNGHLIDLNSKRSNHVFDGAGENIHCYSDSESQGSRKSKTRYINPAIYIETVESSHSVTSLHTDDSCVEVTPHPHSTYRSNSTPFLTGRVSSDSSSSIQRKSCRLAGNENVSGDDEEEDTPRNSRTYREDGQDTFRLSVASMETTTTAKEERERNEKKKKEAFKQWLERKEHERREKLRLEKMKRQVVPTTSAEQREESYRRWLERKRTQAERRRAEEIMRRYRENERLEQERNKREQERCEKLNYWFRRKEEEIKAMKTREERKAARAALEEQKRRANGDRAYRDWLRTSKKKPLPVPLNQGELTMKTREKRKTVRAALEEQKRRKRANRDRAYRDWLRTSKNKPLPVPLNQSELSMRGSVSQMYINPIPWQSPT